MGDYKRTYRNDRGYTVDASGKQKELANAAIARCYDEAETRLSEEEYMASLYPQNHDEYLVDGAILTCNKATKDVKILRGDVYNVYQPCKYTLLHVTENPHAEACGHLHHATIRDSVVNTNIKPFHCNCSIEPDDNEWDILKSDKSYQKEGTCMALMKLNVEWDNLPSKIDYWRFWNEDRFGKIPGITMSSMLFCKHGGIITAISSGQENSLFYFKRLELTKNQKALSLARLQPATSVKDGTQIKIQGLLERGMLYFDENHYERVLNTGLDSDPYLVALGDYYRVSATDVGMGDEQGYGAIFKVTLSSGKEIYVTLGDSKNPAHTAESRNIEGKDYYEGSGTGAHTLEFFCDYDNMSTAKGADKNMGEAITIMDGASITDIELLVGYDIDWTEYFE